MPEKVSADLVEREKRDVRMHADFTSGCHGFGCNISAALRSDLLTSFPGRCIHSEFCKKSRLLTTVYSGESALKMLNVLLRHAIVASFFTF